ncbi:MAG: phage terminase large subunit [Porticoccaceae bacterium]
MSRSKKAEQSPIQPSPFQQRVLLVPEAFDVFLGGGRGGGKSYALALLALRHANQYGRGARVLYIRRTYKALADYELMLRDLFALVYGQGARFNQAEHVWRLPGGGYLELAQMDGPADYSKFQGRSFSLLLIDEAGEWATAADLDRLRSNLRSATAPVRVVMAANPGGVGHAWLSQRYVFRSAPWAPFLEATSGRQWVSCPSTHADNPNIDQSGYVEQLRASCAADPELLRAWLHGDWAIARGAYFGPVIEESRNAVDPWASLPQDWKHRGWRMRLAHDYGSAAPSVTYLTAKSPGDTGPDGRWYPRGSMILVDELATVDPNDPNKGMGYTVSRLADEIKAFARRWGVDPSGTADDAIFSQHGHTAGSIADEFSRAGVYFEPAGKGDRVAGWERMRRLLADAGKPDVPGLYISRACSYWWQTVPYLGRDPRRTEDVDSRGPDHAGDATRYALTAQEYATFIDLRWPT